MSIENDLMEVESSLENCRKTIKRQEILERLRNRKEWKELIEEGYFRDEAARVVALKADLQMRAAGEIQMQWLEDMITGIGAFQQYINFIDQRGEHARQTLQQSQETHAELLKEQLEAGVQ